MTQKSSANTAPADGTIGDSEALARFGTYAAKLILESASPMETLSNLIFLAKGHPRDAALLVEYLAAAEAELNKVANVYTLLLDRLHENRMLPEGWEAPAHLRRA